MTAGQASWYGVQLGSALEAVIEIGIGIGIGSVDDLGKMIGLDGGVAAGAAEGHGAGAAAHMIGEIGLRGGRGVEVGIGIGTERETAIRNIKVELQVPVREEIGRGAAVQEVARRSRRR